MFRHSDFVPKPIARIEQRCHTCKKWYLVPPKQTRQVETHWRKLHKGGFVPFIDGNCPYCKAHVDVIIPGKYDKPGTPKNKCSIQYVVLQ